VNKHASGERYVSVDVEMHESIKNSLFERTPLQEMHESIKNSLFERTPLQGMSVDVEMHESIKNSCLRCNMYSL